MGIQDELFEYYEQRILSILKKVARTAKTKEDLCRELKILRSTISGLGGAQLTKEQKQALKALIDEALKKAGCTRWFALYSLL